MKLLVTPFALCRLWYKEISLLLRSSFKKIGLRFFPSTNRRNVFNLDLHVAVIQDISTYFPPTQTKLTRFSLSIHNHLQRPFYLWSPDPVAIVNQSTWKELDNSKVEEFKRRYRRFLETFDGFVVTYPTSFVDLFIETNKPILAVIATRYEAPYTEMQAKWEELNRSLVAGVTSGQITLIANNAGDAEYIKYFTGLSVPVLPSLCDGKELWSGSSGRRITMAKDLNLRRSIHEKTHGLFQPIESLGRPYKWADLMTCLEVLVIPQNISTMTLFELATAGVPVVVPGRELLKEMKDLYSGVLDELSFAEAYGVDADGRFGESGSPAKWKDGSYLDWWLDRADFLNPELMPNVRVAETYSDLMLSDRDVRALREAATPAIQVRNAQIRDGWQEQIAEWTRSLS